MGVSLFPGSPERSAALNGAMMAGAIKWENGVLLVDTAKVSIRAKNETLPAWQTRLGNNVYMATTPAKPTQAQTNTTLTTGLDTAMRTIDQLTTAFGTLKGSVLGGARLEQPSTSPTAPSKPAMSTTTMILIGAAVLVLFLVLRKKL